MKKSFVVLVTLMLMFFSVISTLAEEISICNHDNTRIEWTENESIEGEINLCRIKSKIGVVFCSECGALIGTVEGEEEKIREHTYTSTKKCDICDREEGPSSFGRKLIAVVIIAWGIFVIKSTC